MYPYGIWIKKQKEIPVIYPTLIGGHTTSEKYKYVGGTYQLVI